MKRKRVILIGVISIIFITLLSCESKKVTKEDIYNFVFENKEMLLESIENKDFDEVEKLKIIEKIKNKEISEDEKQLVEFLCGGSGFASATSYYGFYYTEDNDISAIWCAGPKEEMVPDGKGYSFYSGDDRYYTEEICDKFYYYEAAF